MITYGDKMKFSIIIPIYKVEQFLIKCIESVVNQTYQNIEIILVDDGSPDNCPKMCDEWADKDNRVKVIHKKNEGLIAARKSGLRVATGDYVCFVDGDDWIEPNMYEMVAAEVEKHHPDCVITQFYYSYPDREEKSAYNLSKSFYTRETLEQDVFPTMLFKDRFYQFGIYPCCWTKVFKKELLEKHIYDVDNRIRLGEDIAFTYPCLMECQSVAFIDAALYHYRQNPESMTASYDQKLPEIYLLPFLSLLEKSRELGVNLSDQLPYYLLYLTNYVIRNEASTDNPKKKTASNAVLKNAVENVYLQESIDNINPTLLPVHTKMLLAFIQKQSLPLIRLYMKLLRRTM